MNNEFLYITDVCYHFIISLISSILNIVLIFLLSLFPATFLSLFGWFVDAPRPGKQLIPKIIDIILSFIGMFVDTTKSFKPSSLSVFDIVRGQSLGPLNQGKLDIRMLKISGYLRHCTVLSTYTGLEHLEISDCPHLVNTQGLGR